MTFLAWLGRASRVPVHPFLAAAFPVVFLYAQNVHEAISPYEIFLPLGLFLVLQGLIFLARPSADSRTVNAGSGAADRL